MTLVPAYGRDYNSKSAVMKDFNDNMDFMIVDLFGGNDGRYVNKPQLKGKTVNIRYKKLTRVAVIEVK